MRKRQKKVLEGEVGTEELNPRIGFELTGDDGIQQSQTIGRKENRKRNEKAAFLQLLWLLWLWPRTRLPIFVD